MQWRSKVVSGLVALPGLALAIVSVAADHLRGEAGQEVGPAQAIGCCLGIGIFVAGVLLSPAWKNVNWLTLRWTLALYLATCSVVLAMLGLLSMAAWVLLGFVVAICVLLPVRFGILTLVGVLALQGLASVISRVKVGLTGLPLTVLDVKIALRNPAGLWDALSFPHWTRHLVVAIAIVLLLWWAATGARAVLRIVASVVRRGVGRDALGRLVATALFGALAVSYLESLYADMAADQETWQPEGVAAMADRVGVLPFLAYSYQIEASATGDLYRRDVDATPLSHEEVREAARQYVDFAATDQGSANRLSPNVAVVLAESTFDPGQAFRLQGQWNDQLFKPGPLTVATGPLMVNAIGGGTWISEFETIVGLDSRLFGYSGYYTHASVAPFVERSIAMHLRDRGYRTWAFFPHEGEFYNARRAYEHYGFEKVVDGVELGRGTWIKSDPEMIEAATASLGEDPEAPFFAYILLLENHAPHACGFTDAGRFHAWFADAAEFGPNCALHEYLRRLDSTAAAVRSLRQYLEQQQARTGRPFVLLVFGDHQPHTFTNTSGIQFDYTRMRRTPDAHITFFHFQSSLPARLKCCVVPPPAAMLPTLLSGLVASGPEDLYLGENLWLFSRCGSDAVRRQFPENLVSQQLQPADDRSQACRTAYRRALASYRTSGVVRLMADTSPGG